MADPEHVAIVSQGPVAVAGWREHHPGEPLDLSGASLLGANLSGAKLIQANLSGADLGEANLSGANLSLTNLSGANLRGANLSGAYFSRANLCGANLIEANLGGAGFYLAELRGADLRGANLRGTNLRGANLIQANLGGAGFQAANLSEANLSGAYLNGSKLREIDLLDATANESTSLTGARVHSVAVDRYTPEDPLEMSGRPKGGRRRDGVAMLQNAHSGLKQSAQVLALAVFLLPYLWFVGVQWGRLGHGPRSDRAQESALTQREELGRLRDEVHTLRSQLGLEPHSVESDGEMDEHVGRGTLTAPLSIRRALWNFIRSGGGDVRGGTLNFWPFAAFCFLLACNLLWGLSLWKTRSLELQQQRTGLATRLSLSGFWSGLFMAARWGLLANLLVVGLHTWHFLAQKLLF